MKLRELLDPLVESKRLKTNSSEKLPEINSEENYYNGIKRTSLRRTRSERNGRLYRKCTVTFSRSLSFFLCPSFSLTTVDKHTPTHLPTQSRIPVGMCHENLRSFVVNVPTNSRCSRL